VALTPSSEATPRRHRWPWWSLLPLGLGSWAPLVAGCRCGVWRWTLLGIAWPLLSVASLGLATGSQPHGGLAGLGLLTGWLGGIATSFAIRPGYERRRGRAPLAERPWPEPTARSRAWSVRYGLTAYTATFLGANALAIALYLALDVKFPIGLGVVIVDLTLLAALVPTARRHGLGPADLGLRRTQGARSAGLVLVALIAYIAIAVLWVEIVRPPAPAHTLSGYGTESRLDLVLAGFALVLSAPVVEEIFFRGLLYRCLRNRLAILPAALIAGCMFGLVHITGYPLVTLPVKAAFGLIACLIYERTGSILPGIALHSLVDGSVFEAALTGRVAIVPSVWAGVGVLLLIRAAASSFREARRAAGGGPIGGPGGPIGGPGGPIGGLGGPRSPARIPVEPATSPRAG
jgi:uncharacterized protein